MAEPMIPWTADGYKIPRCRCGSKWQLHPLFEPVASGGRRAWLRCPICFTKRSVILGNPPVLREIAECPWCSMPGRFRQHSLDQCEGCGHFIDVPGDSTESPTIIHPTAYAQMLAQQLTNAPKPRGTQ